MRSIPPDRGKKPNRDRQANRRGQKCRKHPRTRKKRTHQNDRRPKLTSGGRQEPQRREQAPNSGSQQRRRAEYTRQRSEKPSGTQTRGRATSEQSHATTQDEENTPRHSAHRERTQRVAHSTPMPRLVRQTQDEVNTSRPWWENQQQAPRRSQHTKTTVDGSKPQGAGKSRSSGSRRPTAAASKGAEKSVPDNKPKNQQEPCNAGQGHQRTKPRHKTKDEENTPRHSAHRKRMQRVAHSMPKFDPPDTR